MPPPLLNETALFVSMPSTQKACQGLIYNAPKMPHTNNNYDSTMVVYLNLSHPELSTESAQSRDVFHLSKYLSTEALRKKII